MSDKVIIRLEDVKNYFLSNGKYGKFIKVEMNNNQCFNLSLDTEQKQTITKDNLNNDVFNKILKIHTLKQEIKSINLEINELL